jgi:hypothetical protein
VLNRSTWETTLLPGKCQEAAVACLNAISALSGGWKTMRNLIKILETGGIQDKKEEW